MEYGTQTTTPSLAHQAAKGSWVSGVLVIVLLVFAQHAHPSIIDLGALALLVLGLLFGIGALLGIAKHGARGILAPAIVGLAINGLLAFIFVSNFLAARAKALGH